MTHHTSSARLITTFMHYSAGQSQVVVAVKSSDTYGHNPKLGTFSAGPYISRLVQGMNLLDRVNSMELVGSSQPLRLATLRIIRIVACQG